MTNQPAFNLALIGGVRLHAPGGAPVALGRRARGLLAVLALSRERSASRDRLCGLLWADRGEDQARASLRQCLHEIRGELPGTAADLIEADREAVRMNPLTVAVDLEAIEATAQAGDDAALVEALRRIDRDGALAELDISSSFDDWAAGARAQVEARIGAAVRLRLAALEADGDPARLLALADVWTSRDPVDEDVVAAAMRVDLARGATPSAQRRLRQLREALARDGLGDPSPAIAALIDGANTPPVAPRPQAAPVAADAPPLLHVAALVDAAGGAPPHLAAALHDEILSGLSRFRDLRLATSRDGDAEDDYTLLGGLRWSEHAVGISAQLRRGDGQVIWTERFDLPRDSLQDALDRMVGRIVAAVQPAVTRDFVERISHRPTAGLYSRFLLARHASLRPRDHAAALAATAELEAILAADPGFTLPMLALARIYDTDFAWTRAGSSGAAERGRALELARTAFAIDPQNVNAWTHVAWSHIWHGNWDAARRHLDGALTLNPYNVPRLLEVVGGRIYLGDLAGAQELLDKCLEIDPRPGDAFHADRGFLRLMTGDHDAAAADYEMIAAPEGPIIIHQIANAALAGLPIGDLRDRAEALIGPIFPGGIMPGLEVLSSWVANNEPLRLPEHRQRLFDGMKLAFG